MDHAPPNVSSAPHCAHLFVVNVAHFLITGFSSSSSSDDYFRFRILRSPKSMLKNVSLLSLDNDRDDCELNWKYYFRKTARININYNFMLMHDVFFSLYLSLSKYFGISPLVTVNTIRRALFKLTFPHILPVRFRTAYKFLWHVI